MLFNVNSLSESFLTLGPDLLSLLFVLLALVESFGKRGLSYPGTIIVVVPGDFGVAGEDTTGYPLIVLARRGRRLVGWRSRMAKYCSK